MRLCIEIGSRHEQVYVEVDHEEYAHLRQFAGMRGQGPKMTKMVTKAYEYSEMLKTLDYMRKLPGDWDVTRPEDRTTHDKLFGLPLKIRE